MEGEPPCKSIKSTHPPLPIYDTPVTGMGVLLYISGGAGQDCEEGGALETFILTTICDVL